MVKFIWEAFPRNFPIFQPNKKTNVSIDPHTCHRVRTLRCLWCGFASQRVHCGLSVYFISMFVLISVWYSPISRCYKCPIHAPKALCAQNLLCLKEFSYAAKSEKRTYRNTDVAKHVGTLPRKKKNQLLFYEMT